MTFMDGLILFVVVALLGESIWETAKMTWQSGKLSIDRLGALFVGLVLAVGLQIDIFSALGVPFKLPWLGVILTGILLSRGANFIHDLIDNVGQITTAKKLDNLDMQSYLDNREAAKSALNMPKQEPDTVDTTLNEPPPEDTPTPF